MGFQTTANSNAFLMGSATIYISGSTDKSTTTGSFIDLGSARGVKLTETWDVLEVEIDNTPKYLVGAKNQQITIEANLLELDFYRMQMLRGGLDTFSTTTYTFDTGGNITITPQAIYLKHEAASSSETIIATVFYASMTEGLSIPFVSDNGTDVSEIPIKLVGKCMSTRTAGEQLYSIVDSRQSIYEADYSDTTP